MPSEPMHNPKAELQPEYRFDYQKAKPNRFVHQTRGQAARGDGNPDGRTGLEEDQREAAQPPEVAVCLQRRQGGGARAGDAQAREAVGEFDEVVGAFAGGDTRASVGIGVFTTEVE